MPSGAQCFLVVTLFRAIQTCVAMSDEQMWSHARLAVEVRRFYGASSIFNVYNDKNSDREIMSTMLRLSLRFSRSDVLVHSTKMSKVKRYAEYYQQRTLRSLYIITLKTQLDMTEFVKFASDFKMSLNLWLVFIYKSRELLKYCARPDRNLFNVSFDTRMLVKCENDPTVREWYALGKDAVRVVDLASWSVESGWRRVTNKSLWERRSSLDGISLRIAAVKESVYTATESKRKRSSLHGLFGAVLRELALAMNFTFELISIEDMYGSFEPDSGTWSGVIGRLVDKDVDVGVAEFGQSNERLKVVDFTVPLLLTWANLYLKEPNMSAIMWSTYVQVFDTRIWKFTLVLAIVCSVVISLMAAKVEQKQVLTVAVDTWFYVWGIQCQQGFPGNGTPFQLNCQSPINASVSQFPTASSLRIAFMSIMITSMVIYSSYSATLTSYLALFVPSLPFNSEPEFLLNAAYNLSVVRGSVYHDILERAESRRAKLLRRRLNRDEDLPKTMVEAIDQVCQEKVVLISNELFIEKLRNKMPCPLVAISLGRLESIAFPLTKRSQFREIFDFYKRPLFLSSIEHFRSYGIIQVLRNRHLPKISPTKMIYLPVSFYGIVPLITIYFSGVGLAIVILICELLHHRYWYARRSAIRNIRDKYLCVKLC
ncbi:LOW QUALITY PROTEIN: probable glutamate receptor [Phymastichus coffea]|uniref:LOW QUALITY PROTEIN: probable glutamate receptor n=1 Tax=Phymastichus coffea TaxID=108790 RepID=UPI00273AA758|nr:LOW QUALITY PROTEIN: probable glutamate receptor [Phymastichus coffea]